MISKQEVQHIAKLARLGLSQKEIKKFEKELSSILDYAKKIKKIDVSKVRATTHPFFLENVTREDRVKKQKPTLANKLVEATPEKKGRYVKVKSVL